MTSSENGQDPSRHILVWQKVRRQPDGSHTRTPVELDEAAAVFARTVEKGRPDELTLDSEDESDVVAFSAARGDVISALLKELALRLEPGRAVGPIQSDGSLSRIAHEVAWHLRHGTGL